MGPRCILATLAALLVLASPVGAAWSPRPAPAPLVAPIVGLPSCAASSTPAGVDGIARRYGIARSVIDALTRLQDETGVAPADGARALAGRTGGVRALPFRARRALGRLLDGDEVERVVALASCIWAGDPAAALGREVLADRRVEVYVDGRGDLLSRRVDRRVAFAIRYLEAAFGAVAVSSIESGHRARSSAGSESSHAEGRAFDVVALGAVRVAGHQGPGSVTERAVRLLLLLPADRAPEQIVSLLDVDGATGFHGSFAQADHADHLHVGFGASTRGGAR